MNELVRAPGVEGGIDLESPERIPAEGQSTRHACRREISIFDGEFPNPGYFFPHELEVSHVPLSFDMFHGRITSGTCRRAMCGDS